MARYDSFTQYASDKIGIAIVELTDLTDADGDVTVTVVRDADVSTVVTAAVADHDDIGLYSYTMTLQTVTGTKGDYTATWSWEIDGNDRLFVYHFTVTDPQPYWDTLDADQKQLVDNVYHKVSDSFDSTKGGPYLWELPQSSFSLETVARLMVVDAMTLINYSGPKAFVPPYGLGNNVNKPFPVGWYGLLERATQYELFKHLSTSYLEYPLPQNMNVAWLDRQRYSDMWMRRADHEKEELDHMLHMLKRDMQFGVKTRAMLLAGGIFPVSYLNPARPRWPYVLSRFY